MLNKVISAFIFIAIGAATACATSELTRVPALEFRTLRISRDIVGFEYQWEECTAHFIWCTKKEMQKEYYDLTKKDVREKLINMGFVAKVREKI
jgi:hypothetical protein